MIQSIESVKNRSIIRHIHGMGGIGKSSLLKYWNETIDDSVLIDCNLFTDVISQIGNLVRSYKSKGFSFPRFDLLWSLRIRILDGVEPAKDEGRKWLVDAIGLIPGVGSLVDTGSKLVEVGKKLKDCLRTKQGNIHKWLQNELGKKWEVKLIHILWKNPDQATLLFMNAVRSDLNERESIDSKTLVILIDNVDSHTVSKWNIDGHLSDDVGLWQKMLSGVKSCIGVFAGRSIFDKDWAKVVGLEQYELTELELKAREELYRSRNFLDKDLKKSVDRICKGNPFMMQLLIDAVQKYKMTQTEIDNIKSESLDDVRTEIWRVFFSRIGQLTEILDRAALLPFFDKDILSVVYPKMKIKDWIEFQSLSFVRLQKGKYWTIHDLARELVIAEFGANIVQIVQESEILLLNKYRDCDDPLYYGLAVSLREFISIESAIESLNMIVMNFRMENKSNYILRAIEGVRFRSNRLTGHLELTKGNTLIELIRFSEAERHIKNALEILRNLPDETQNKQSDIAYALNGLGTLLGDIGRGQEAEQIFQEALSIRRKLANPSDVASQANLAAVLGNLGHLYSI